MRAALSAFLRNDDGATAIEYALIGMLVAVAIVSGLTLVSDSLENIFGLGTGSPASVINNAAESL